MNYARFVLHGVVVLFLLLKCNAQPSGGGGPPSGSGGGPPPNSNPGGPPSGGPPPPNGGGPPPSGPSNEGPPPPSGGGGPPPPGPTNQDPPPPPPNGGGGPAPPGPNDRGPGPGPPMIATLSFMSDCSCDPFVSEEYAAMIELFTSAFANQEFLRRVIDFQFNSGQTQRRKLYQAERSPTNSFVCAGCWPKGTCRAFSWCE